MLLSRTDRSYFSEWWWTVDRLALFICIILMVIGLVLALAASPAVAIRIGLDEMALVKKQLTFIPVALIVMLSISFINSESLMRYLALALFVGGIALMVYVLLFEDAIKGSYRWANLRFMTVQPSEIVKPGFVILTAWLYAEAMKSPQVKAKLMAFGLYVLFATLLILQPDMGQTMLITIVWFCLFLLSGASVWVLGGLFSAFTIGGLIAYNTMAHVRSRIDRFFNPEGADTYQVDMAMQSFSQGGWFGKGPGESSVKALLPDAHSDFIFAVVGEEFGIVGNLLIVSLYAVLIYSFLRHAFSVDTMFKKLSITGLTVLFGSQAFINMGVNLNLLPAKGMTLPFISYGGSSLISMAVIAGLLLALTKERPRLDNKQFNEPRFV